MTFRLICRKNQQWKITEVGEDKEIQAVFLCMLNFKKTLPNYYMILLEMQNDANQHILLTISITDAGSSCDAFCPLYLSQWWLVYACRCREVYLGISHPACWSGITLYLALLPSTIP